MTREATLNYARPVQRQPSASALTSFIIGVLVTAEALWAVVQGVRMPKNATDGWAILGFFLLAGAALAVIGIGCAFYGLMLRHPANRFRSLGLALNGLYLVGYRVVVAACLIFA